MPGDQDVKKPTVFKEDDNKQTENKDTKDLGGKTSLGLEPNLAGLICYLFGFISGLILFLMEKENRFVRFHAMQSIVMSVAIFIISFVMTLIPIIGWIVGLLIAPLSFVLWIFMMFKAYQGEWYKLPWVGDFSEQQIDK